MTINACPGFMPHLLRAIAAITSTPAVVPLNLKMIPRPTPNKHHQPLPEVKNLSPSWTEP